MARASLVESLFAPYRAGFAGLDRRIHLVVGGTFLFIAARMGLYTFLGIYFVREVGLPITLVGTAFLVENVMRGVTAPFLGALSDRVGRQPVLVVTALFTAATLPLFLLAHDALGLLAWSAAVGAAQGGFFPVATGLLLDLAPPGRHQSVLAVNYTALSLGYTLGVAPAGYLTQFGYGWLAAASSAGFLGIALFAFFGLKGLPRSAREPLVRNMLLAPRDPTFVTLVLLSALFPLGLGMMSLVIPIYGTGLGIPETTIGLVLSTSGILLALFAVPVNARVESSGPFRWLPACALLMAAAYVVAQAWPSAWGLLAALAVFTLAEVVFSAAIPTAVASLAPAHAKGAYQGAYSFVFAVSVGASLLLAGWGRDHVGWGVTWLALAAVTVAGGAAFLALRPWFRRVAEARKRAAEDANVLVAAAGSAPR